MLWKDFAEKESCDGCPLLENEICPGGWKCYGNEPIEPPCCSFADDTDLDIWVERFLIQQQKWEEREDRKIREERKKKERAEKAVETRREMRWYCRGEIRELKQPEKALQAQKAVERLASDFAEAINFTNEMFRYKERKQVKPEISAEVKRLEEEVALAKEKYNAKRTEFYAKRKAESKEIDRD